MKTNLTYRKFLGEYEDAFVAVREKTYDDGNDQPDGVAVVNFVLALPEAVFAENSAVELSYTIARTQSSEERLQAYEEAVKAMEAIKTAANAVIDFTAEQFARFEQEGNEYERQARADAREAEYDNDVPF